MAGITGLGTTYNLPNYTGILHGLSPAATPFFSAIGGLNGGAQTTSPEFEWSTYDLRNPGQNTKTEGATAPDASARVRSNVTNVTQIHQSKVSTSYSKQGARGQKSGTNNDKASNVQSERDWQIEQELKQMVLDVEWSFLNGVYAKPSTNADARKTRGLVAAITTNKLTRGTAITGASSATDTITSTAHGLANDTAIVFSAVGAATNIVPGRVYYVASKATDTFKVVSAVGGTAITLGTASDIAFRIPATAATDVDDINDLAQKVYDNGGSADGETATLIVNSVQKRAITAAYASAYGKFVETSRNVGGVGMTTLVTDFGILNLMASRHVAQDSVILADLGLCRPIYLEVDGKGHFFAEPLAKTGASDDVQLYGEVGLEYGPETAHGIITGLKV